MKDLRYLLFEVIELSEMYSKNVYEKISPILQEQSHSFGTEFFANLAYFIIKKLDEIHESSELEYLYYEKYIRTKEELSELLKIEKDYEKEYISLIFKIAEKIVKADYELGALFASLLTAEKDSTSKHSFIYTNKLLRFIEERLDVDIYKITNREYAEYGEFYNCFFKEEFNKAEECLKRAKRCLKINRS